MNTLQAIIIAIVEGITEFLPISSTGHMILTQHLLGLPSSEFLKAFIVNIQFGAILSVIVLYWKRFFQSFDFYYKLFLAFIPAAIIGFLLSKYIDQMLGSVMVVGVSLLLGGVILLFVDKWFNHSVSEKPVSWQNAIKIGLFQCISMIPGVSRSAATIVGGMTQGLSRKQAAEFSFFLAVPTMLAASAYKLIENYKVITPDNVKILVIGNGVAFIVAMLAIKAFIGFLTRYGFKWFGWYRIIVGLVIIALYFFNVNLELPE